MARVAYGLGHPREKTWPRRLSATGHLTCGRVYLRSESCFRGDGGDAAGQDDFDRFFFEIWPNDGDDRDEYELTPELYVRFE
jgi:hypothetical protein